MHHDKELQRHADATGTESKFAALFKRWRVFALVVLLPSLLGTLYYGFIAADIYVSESRFVIKAPDRKNSGGSPLSSLLQSTGLGSGEEQASEIVGYLQSRDALADLSKRTGVRAAFSSEHADLLSRFPLLFRGQSFEDLYEYYKSMVRTAPDPNTGLTVLEVSAYTPREAQALNIGLLKLSEDLVNRLNQRINSQTITEAENRVELAQERVRDARIKLGAYRNSSEILDPEQQGMGVLAVSNELIAREAALRAQLNEMRRTAPNHPAILALKERIASVSQQVASQNARAVGTPDGLASKLSQYENLVVEQEFATQMLTAANASLEQARAEAVQQQYYLERVVEPNLPDAPILPNRLKNVLAIVLATLCLYLVGWMLAVGVREHAPEN